MSEICDTSWNEFEKTGKIEDYLKYKGHKETEEKSEKEYISYR